MGAAAFTDIFKARTKAPLTRGFFISRSAGHYRHLTSNDGANSGGASDGGDASPNAGGASGGGASPNAFGPSRDDGHGPSVLLPARGDRPPRST
jgi:hypothetical protein